MVVGIIAGLILLGLALLGLWNHGYGHGVADTEQRWHDAAVRAENAWGRERDVLRIELNKALARIGNFNSEAKQLRNDVERGVAAAKTMLSANEAKELRIANAITTDVKQAIEDGKL